MFGFARNRRRRCVPWQHRYWQWRAKVAAWLRVVLAILACWLLFVVSYLGFEEPAARLIAAARWVGAALLDTIGLDHWTWTVTTKEGDELWESNLIHLDSWHLDQVEAVVATFWTAITWTVGLTVLGLSLFLAWWLGKRQTATRYQRQPAVPAAQHLAAADDESRPGLPARAEERPAALPDDQQQDQREVDQEDQPDIEGLFQHDQGVGAWDDARPRKPVARRKWNYRPC